MALPSTFGAYGGFQSSGTQAPTQLPQGYGQQPLVQPDPNATSYNQPYPTLRTTSNQATINPLGTGNITDRINSLTNSYYSQIQAQQNAKNMLTANTFNQGLSNLGSLRTDPSTARNIFQGAYNAGLTGTNPNQQQGWHVGDTTQDNPNSLESQYAAQNRGIYGAVNRADLTNVGINPNAVSQAYQNFLNTNTSGRY